MKHIPIILAALLLALQTTLAEDQELDLMVGAEGMPILAPGKPLPHLSDDDLIIDIDRDRSGRRIVDREARWIPIKFGWEAWQPTPDVVRNWLVLLWQGVCPSQFYLEIRDYALTELQFDYFMWASSRTSPSALIGQSEAWHEVVTRTDQYRHWRPHLWKYTLPNVEHPYDNWLRQMRREEYDVQVRGIPRELHINRFADTRYRLTGRTGRE